MQAPVGFNGLIMPVLAAFGWAGEETALKFAISQLETFIAQLHAALSRDGQTLLPFYGLDRESNTVFLARSQETESDVHVVFYARPMAFRMSIDVTERAALNRALKGIMVDTVRWHRILKELEGDWSLQVKQMEYDPESGASTLYKDLYKGPVTGLTIDSCTELFERAAYLNGEERWLAPIYLVKTQPSEFIAAMGTAVIDVLAKEFQSLLPLLNIIIGSTPRPVLKARPRTRGKDEIVSIAPKGTPAFTYIATLKPLHIRKGFIMLELEHWAFFARSARSETRAVTVHYEGSMDKDSAIWRLAANDSTRLVLGHHAHNWLENSCQPDDKIKLTVIKSPSDEVDIELQILDQPA